MLDPLYNCNESLNSTVDFDEVKSFVLKSKNGKSTGNDNIPYEILKYDCVIRALHKLFQLCFETHIIPSEWRKAVICPIPKDTKADPRIPMNYRGISLLSTVSKLYSSVLNNRLLSYLEDNEILVDEQNGFRRDGRVLIIYFRSTPCFKIDPQLL